MESRVCPQCGSKWYSANCTTAWVCERCGNEIQEGKSMEIKDSGERRTFPTGSMRDVSEGKGRCDPWNLDHDARGLHALTIQVI